MKNAMPQKSSTPQHPSVLVLEDDQTTSDLICVVLKKHGIQTVPCFSAKDADSVLRKNEHISAMLVDLSLPDGDGIDVLRTSGQLNPELPCFVLTAKNSVDSAVLAMKAGAQDYFTKPFETEKMVTSLQTAMAVFANRTITRNHDHLPLQGSHHWKSRIMRQALESAKQAAKTQSPVLISGGQYTSKKAFAQLIHKGGKRKNKPLLTINPAVMPAAQVEMELFGMALSQTPSKPGYGIAKLEKFRDATIYIENIELLSPQAQARLHEWLMANEDDVAACRLITASTLELSKTIKEGRFRRDLWYALSVYRVEVPLLAERPEDIPQLCEDAITRICISKKLRRPTLTRKTLETLMDYSWPGNLSEFYSVLEHAVTHTTDRLICPADLPPLRSPSGQLHSYRSIEGIPLGTASIDDITKLSLVSALEACGGNRRRAAERLNVSLRTVYNMIRRYELTDV
ncbi:MAG: sigma 54-interacting transcriptional regulator [Luteolibacter sp.]